MSEDPSPMPLDPLEAFEQVVRGHPGFRLREGQHRMARLVAATFADVTLGKVEPDEPVERAIAVIEAGTGVGKSLAYAAPAIATALARKTRVLISTATVALQEQLVNKDLPLLAQALDLLLAEPLRFALAKGRARYVCKFKLARLAEPSLDDEMADLLEEAVGNDCSGGIVRIVEEEQPGALGGLGVNRLEIGGESELFLQGKQHCFGAGENRATGVNRVTGIGSQGDVTRIEEGETEVVDAFLGADRRNHFVLGIDLDPEPPAVEVGKGAAELFAAPVARVVLVAPVGHRILHRADHMRVGRMIGVTDSKTDHIDARSPLVSDLLLELGEHVRRHRLKSP